MKKAEQTTRVRAISAYLEGIGQPVTNVQCYEILARALGLKNKHVLASLGKEAGDENTPAVPAAVMLDGTSVPVMPVGAKPYTVEEMKAMDWEFDVIIPLSLDEIEAGDIERQNELASEFITGNDCALENIGYDHIPEVGYGKGYVAYRVTGYISEPGTFFSEIQDEEDAQFYAELKELAGVLKEDTCATLSLMSGDVTQPVVIRKVNSELVALLKAYAECAGDNNLEVIEHSSETVLELYPAEGTVTPVGPEGMSVALRDLKYASKLSSTGWYIPIHESSVRLTFNS